MVSPFLSRVSTAVLIRDIDIAFLSVCHVPVLYLNGLTYRHIFFSVCQHDHSVFPVPGSLGRVAAIAAAQWQPRVSRMFRSREKLSSVTHYPTLKFILSAAAATAGVPYAFPFVKNSPPVKIHCCYCARCLRATFLRQLSFLLIHGVDLSQRRCIPVELHVHSLSVRPCTTLHMHSVQT